MLKETFKALSDPVRREILKILKNFDLNPATISYHLSILKNAELIFETKYKNFIYYEINTSVFEEVILWLSEIGGGNDEKEKNK